MSNSNEIIGADSNNINTKQVIKVIGFIVLGVVGFYFANFHNGLSGENGAWGTFGDYFGGILNPVIASFAFYLIAKTYELQKRELEATRSLLEVSTDAQKNQIKLAALTALLNSNLTRISLLESEKLSLLESELRNPRSKAEVDCYDYQRKALRGEFGTHVKDRRDYIKDEITELEKKNIGLETQIEEFSKK
jgi:large-conductance mechanosensitive channel